MFRGVEVLTVLMRGSVGPFRRGPGVPQNGETPGIYVVFLGTSKVRGFL